MACRDEGVVHLSDPAPARPGSKITARLWTPTKRVNSGAATHIQVRLNEAHFLPAEAGGAPGMGANLSLDEARSLAAGLVDLLGRVVDLPERDRRIVWARLVLGESAAAVAAASQMTVAHVRQILARVGVHSPRGSAAARPGW